MFKLSFDDEGATKKQTVAMHTSYMSCCTFTNSDQQVGTLTNTVYVSGVLIIDVRHDNKLWKMSDQSQRKTKVICWQKKVL